MKQDPQPSEQLPCVTKPLRTAASVPWNPPHQQKAPVLVSRLQPEQGHAPRASAEGGAQQGSASRVNPVHQHKAFCWCTAFRRHQGMGGRRVRKVVRSKAPRAG